MGEKKPPQELIQGTSSVMVQVLVDHLGKNVYVMARTRLDEQNPVVRHERFPGADPAEAIELARFLVAVFGMELSYGEAMP